MPGEALKSSPVHCLWCSQPATTEIETRPSRFGVRRGERLLLQRSLTAPACAEHAESFGTPLRPAPPRSVPITGQTTIFDFLDA